MNKKMMILAMASILIPHAALAQKVALKTNLLYDATTTINLGAEVALAPKWTLDVSGNYNGWTFSNNRKWKHWLVQPELRYWTCNKMMGHFFALHAVGGRYNVGNIDIDMKLLGTDFSQLKDYRYEGWAIGAGIGYGYAWPIAKHWNMEAEIGIGWAYTRYDKYECQNCGQKVVDDKGHHYVGPTKAALNLVYVF